MGINRSRFLKCALLAAAALIPACSSSATAPSDAVRAFLTVTVTPNPLIADAVPGGYQLSFVIKVTETAGVGGTFEFVNSTVFDETTGRQLAVNNFDDKDMIVFVGSDRLEPQSSVDIPQTIAYITPSGGSAAVLTVAVRFNDDKNIVTNESILVKVG